VLLWKFETNGFDIGLPDEEPGEGVGLVLGLLLEPEP
jgi:hypothetical protein